MFDLAALRALSVDALLAVALGLLLLVAALGLLGKVMPFSLETAISKQRNDAVSVILFSVLLGLGIILSSTLRPSEEASEGGEPAAASASARPPLKGPRAVPTGSSRR